MKRRSLLLALAALPALALAEKPAAGLPADRMVFQMSEGEGGKWVTLLRNLRNIQAALGRDKVALAVVAIGPGLGMLKADSVVASEVGDAQMTGVDFVACENSMHAQHLAREDLVEGLSFAAAGYVELMRRQQQGWAYLRP